ncbi:MAG TPA: non-heme iron oxygenase ferredoxin subunit [Planctomycetota bacterium]|nr:non-heme iron oxygenase ferredoxin subunit [Planctomycetota bacterium]
MPRQWITITSIDEIPEGETRTFEVGPEWIALCKRDGQVWAVEDFCPHDTGPLGEGTLEGHEIICPRHGARFDIRTGDVKRLPALCGIRTFPVRVVDGRVEVEIEIE